MTQHPILLTTLNARYSHAALGLRCLLANLGELAPLAAIREFHINQPPLQAAEALLAEEPQVIGLGVYIWNLPQATELAVAIKTVRPQTILVLGGPEVSHEYESLRIFQAADYLVRGEGECAFAALASELLAGRRPAQKVIDGGQPDLQTLALPYALYTGEDITHRRLYVETSRGCLFRCEFCLSSLDERVREFDLAAFFAAMEELIARGARQFHFVDRTFNLGEERAVRILEFFLERWGEGMDLHFEIVPDRLPAGLRAAIARVPEGGIHLEAGLQTLNPEVQANISRRQSLERTFDNLQFLREETRAWLHADLIIGLPGESWDSFAEGFDRTLALRPQQVQVGVLKRLRGAPIARHMGGHAMVYAEQPPYEILQTGLIPFARMQRLKRLARYFDLFYNSGNFARTLPLLWEGRSPFAAFMALCDSLWQATGRTSELALLRLSRHLYEHILDQGHIEPDRLNEAIQADYYRCAGRREKLEFLKE